MFPPSVYSNQVSLRLPAPLPLKVSPGVVWRTQRTLFLTTRYTVLALCQISSLSLYSLTFALARHGMHGKSPRGRQFPRFLCLDTLTRPRRRPFLFYSAPYRPPRLFTQARRLSYGLVARFDPGRTAGKSADEQGRRWITEEEAGQGRPRSLRSVPSGRTERGASPILPLYEAIEWVPFDWARLTHRTLSFVQPTSWQTSSLYTFSPVSGLITEHLVETIRPLPGESVGAWLSARLWHGRAGESEGYQTIPGVGIVGVDLDLGLGTGMTGMTRGGADRAGLVRVVEVVEDPVRPPIAADARTAARGRTCRGPDVKHR